MTLADQDKMVWRDRRLVKEHILISTRRNEVNLCPQCFLHRERKGQEVCQVRQEHLDFRWGYLYLFCKQAKYVWNVFSFQLRQLSFHQGDEGPVGPAGPAGAEVSADWISSATEHQTGNKMTLRELSEHRKARWAEAHMWLCLNLASDEWAVWVC